MAQKSWKIEEIFPRFVNAQMAKGVSDKTVLTYNRHFRSLGYHLDMTMTFDELTKEALDSMLVSLRKSGVSPNTISSYARVLFDMLKNAIRGHWDKIILDKSRASPVDCP